MSGKPLNVNEVLDGLAECWSPQVVAAVNDYDVKAVKLEGHLVPQHVHEATDECFVVFAGRLRI